MSDILGLQGVNFEVIPSTFEEDLPKDQFPSPVWIAGHGCIDSGWLMLVGCQNDRNPT